MLLAVDFHHDVAKEIVIVTPSWAEAEPLLQELRRTGPDARRRRLCLTAARLARGRLTLAVEGGRLVAGGSLGVASRPENQTLGT